MEQVGAFAAATDVHRGSEAGGLNLVPFDVAPGPQLVFDAVIDLSGSMNIVAHCPTDYWRRRPSYTFSAVSGRLVMRTPQAS